MSVVTPSQAAVVGAEHSVPSTMSGRLGVYLEMCRPRIAVMTMIAASAGFVLASPIVIEWPVLGMALVGIVQLVAASSIWNQVLEVATDRRMARTAERPLVTGRVSRREAALAGLLLAAGGTATLWLFVNPATTVAGLATLLSYVILYTPLKTRSTLCTTIGAVPGAMPPVLGWLAAGGALGTEALALFGLLFTWQFPHFLAIGWIYRNDYEQAGLRMLPSFADGGRRTALVAVIYAVAFIPVCLLPGYTGVTGGFYIATALVMSGIYFAATVRFAVSRTTRSARDLLLISIMVLPLLLLVMVAEFLHLTAFGL